MTGDAAPGAASGQGTVAPDPRLGVPDVLFFCIGAQKAGTSWLHFFLKSHPDVCLPPMKEMHYWNTIARAQRPGPTGMPQPVTAYPRDGDSARRQAILDSRDASHASYADFMLRRHKGERVLGEITPDYQNLSLDMLCTMAGLNSDTRFIFLMRDPVERLNSGIRKRIRGRSGNDRKQPISGAMIVQEMKDMLDAGFMKQIDRSRYDRTLPKLDRLVERTGGRARVGLFFYEDILLRRNTDPVCDFLSIARRPGDFDTIANPGNPVVDDCAQAFLDLAMKPYAKTYQYMADRFGAALPSEWRRQMEQAHATFA